MYISTQLYLASHFAKHILFNVAHDFDDVLLFFVDSLLAKMQRYYLISIESLVLELECVQGSFAKVETRKLVMSFSELCLRLKFENMDMRFIFYVMMSFVRNITDWSTFTSEVLS
jgi:hypothetical protein